MLAFCRFLVSIITLDRHEMWVFITIILKYMGALLRTCDILEIFTVTIRKRGSSFLTYSLC